MTHDTWIKSITGDSARAVAKRIGIPQRTLAAQLEDDRVSPENVIATAIAYGASPVDALVETGYLPEEHARPITLRGAGEDVLADEILRRMSGQGDHAALHAPVDELMDRNPNHERAFPGARHA